MALLADLDGFDWCGIYRLEGGYLELDAFVGSETEHTRIGVGQGVCGSAVSEGKNQVVDDVSTLENYLSCSVKTRSEIVVLIRSGDEILGQIDIDSHEKCRFSGDEESFLDELAGLVADRWSEPSKP